MRSIVSGIRDEARRAFIEVSVVRRVLRGDPTGISGPKLRLATRWLLAVGMVVANLGGFFAVLVLLLAVLPYPPGHGAADVVRPANSIPVFSYAAIALLLGLARGLALSTRPLRWLEEDRPPTARERLHTLRLPVRLMRMQILMWALGVVLIVAVNIGHSWVLALQFATTVALAGLSTAAVAYLVLLRVGRATVVRALDDAPPRHYGLPGIAAHVLFFWAFGTTVPVIGIVILTALTLDQPESGVTLQPETEAITHSALVLSIAALVVGFGTMLVFARWMADPLEVLRDALDRVEHGDFTTKVSVYDYTEVGFALSGFNAMVAGLREREEMRDLFGRHVGEEVARRALEEGVTLGGEERQAAALFVDIVGSTRIAVEHGPTKVVNMLNMFFAIVVDETVNHGGLVNKFEGDAALCIFGTPLTQEDPAGAALAAARAMQERLASEIPEVPAAIGLSAGNVVAGNVGAAHRFEYTVIGDPVNQASRLTELAKERTGRLVACEAIVSLASEEEQALWQYDDYTVVLRGRTEPTRLAVPREAVTAG